MTNPVQRAEQTLWIWEDGKIIKKPITFAPIVYQIFDETLISAANGGGASIVEVTIANDMIKVSSDGEGLPDLTNSNFVRAFQTLTEFTAERGEDGMRMAFNINVADNNISVWNHGEGVHDINFSIILKALGFAFVSIRKDDGNEGFKEEMKLSYGEQYLQLGNGAQAAVEAIGQNGVSERRNRTLLDMVRSMFNLTSLPLSFWDYALESVVRILNIVPTNKAYVKRDSADKLHQRSVKCIFVGYPKETMGYYFYVPPENKVIVASEIPVESKSLGSPSELIPVCRSERTTRAPNRLCLNIEVEDDEVGDLGEPANYKVTMLDPDKVVRSKWLYKKKTDMDGKVHTYKACLLAKGCTQTYGIDYDETFSPVADIRAIRILVAIAAYYDYEIWQMDVKTAFLNGRLDEDIYMEQPEGYVDPKYLNRVCKTSKIYLWFEASITSIE
nr:hypothetical protein [Tanacetum cinerariifolium]